MSTEETTSGYDLIARDFVISANIIQAVAEALEQAKETIYIADWWLSPELVSLEAFIHVSNSPFAVPEATTLLQPKVSIRSNTQASSTSRCENLHLCIQGGE
jgi:hypothetical protein